MSEIVEKKLPCALGHRLSVHDCPNMKEVEGDTSMTHEHYECKVCGHSVALDYDEMR